VSCGVRMSKLLPEGPGLSGGDDWEEALGGGVPKATFH